MKFRRVATCSVVLMLASTCLSKLEYPYKLISFDYYAHEPPLAYRSFGNTVELGNKVKLTPPVEDRGGAYSLAYPLKN